MGIGDFMGFSAIVGDSMGFFRGFFDWNSIGILNVIVTRSVCSTVRPTYTFY